MKTALYWHADDGGRLRCDLCPHGCRVRDGKTGICGVRRADGGEIKAAGYGLVSAAGMDPVEKKPLYHFYPGSTIFSIGGYGCNFRCVFCQNWSISQRVTEQDARYSPEQIIRLAGGSDSVGIAYTYNEPLINYEFVLDCARMARDRGLRNVLVTNGFIQPKPAAELLPYVDALNIDVKSMEEAFYTKHCGGALPPVLAFARQARLAGAHLEITCLLIPGLNDDDANVRDLAKWIAAELGAETPLHLSAYRPEYKLRVPATPPELLLKAHRICTELLTYVYLGNVQTEEGRDTSCPGCGQVLIERVGYQTTVCGIEQGKCRGCGRAAELVLAPQPTLPPPRLLPRLPSPDTRG